MKMITKATGDGIAYASKSDYEWEGKQYEADLKNGDWVTIEDAGSIETGQFGDQHYFRIKTRNGTKKAPFNQSTINVLVEAFGDESEAWVGKDVKVLITKTVIGGKKVMPAYFVTDEWYLDDFGDLEKQTDPAPRTDGPGTATGGTKKPDYPEKSDEELDVPFK